MANKINYSPNSLKNIEEIITYIENDLDNKKAAENFLNGILEKIDLLKDFPEIGKEYSFENGVSTGYRFLIYKSYIIFYRLNDKKEIFIDLIVHETQNYKKLLNIKDNEDE